ncbi:MAG: BON domain-containing protein [Burkholderiaceae bacterium]
MVRIGSGSGARDGTASRVRHDAAAAAWLRVPLLVIGLLSSMAQSTFAADPASLLRNWFDDPFLRLTDGIGDCPVPAGPATTEDERRLHSHWRAERGTTCWLAGECDRPNAFAYDRDIAAALRAAWPADGELGATSLWATVQGRIVYLDGCAVDPAIGPRIEALVRSLPHVQQVVSAIRTDPSERPPYRLAAGP